MFSYGIAVKCVEVGLLTSPSVIGSQHDASTPFIKISSYELDVDAVWKC
jgi:hypothetical protein